MCDFQTTQTISEIRDQYIEVIKELTDRLDSTSKLLEESICPRYFQQKNMGENVTSSRFLFNQTESMFSNISAFTKSFPDVNQRRPEFLGEDTLKDPIRKPHKAELYTILKVRPCEFKPAYYQILDLYPEHKSMPGFNFVENNSRHCHDFAPIKMQDDEPQRDFDGELIALKAKREKYAENSHLFYTNSGNYDNNSGMVYQTPKKLLIDSFTQYDPLDITCHKTLIPEPISVNNLEKPASWTNSHNTPTENFQVPVKLSSKLIKFLKPNPEHSSDKQPRLSMRIRINQDKCESDDKFKHGKEDAKIIKRKDKKTLKKENHKFVQVNDTKFIQNENEILHGVKGNRVTKEVQVLFKHPNPLSQFHSDLIDMEQAQPNCKDKYCGDIQRQDFSVQDRFENYPSHYIPSNNYIRQNGLSYGHCYHHHDCTGRTPQPSDSFVINQQEFPRYHKFIRY